jgi:hypothetical protein
VTHPGAEAPINPHSGGLLVVHRRVVYVLLHSLLPYTVCQLRVWGRCETHAACPLLLLAAMPEATCTAHSCPAATAVVVAAAVVSRLLLSDCF